MENAAAPAPSPTLTPPPAPAQSELVLKGKKIGNNYMAFISAVDAIVAGLGYVARASDKVERARTQGVGTVIREMWTELKGTNGDQNCKRCAEYSEECYRRIDLIMEHLKIRIPKDAKSGIEGKVEKEKEHSTYLPIYGDRAHVVVGAWVLMMNRAAAQRKGVKNIRQPSGIGYMPKSLDGTSGNGSMSPMSMSFRQVYNSNKPRHAYDTIAYDTIDRI